MLYILLGKTLNDQEFCYEGMKTYSPVQACPVEIKRLRDRGSDREGGESEIEYFYVIEWRLRDLETEGAIEREEE
jgi:hypothetical protein